MYLTDTLYWTKQLHILKSHVLLTHTVCSLMKEVLSVYSLQYQDDQQATVVQQFRPLRCKTELQFVCWWSSSEVIWSHRCLRRGREAPLYWCSVYIWGIGAVEGPGNSCGSSTHVHSPTEYSHVADWGKSHRHSLCVPRPRHEGPLGPSLQRVLLALQPAVSQIPSSPAPAPSELLVGSSSVDRPRGGPPLLPKQRRQTAPSTTRPCSLALHAGSRSPQCSRSTVNR